MRLRRGGCQDLGVYSRARSSNCDRARGEGDCMESGGDDPGRGGGVGSCGGGTFYTTLMCMLPILKI